jgi:mono/diheme cytochrome c family protein
MASLLALVTASCAPALPPDASGEEIYQARCASCHGGDLEGSGSLVSGRGPALGAESEAAGRADSLYVQAITRGTGRMPAVRSLTDEQVTRVIAYIRRVQREG